MKIEIHSSDMPHVFDYRLYDLNNRKFVTNYIKGGVIDRLGFDENDIYELLGEKQYKKFEDGKYTFELTKKQIYNISQDIRYYNPKQFIRG